MTATTHVGPSLSRAAVNTIYTDVLVIGGGFAGCFAAIKAAEAGADVVMAVKGRTGRSGLTPWANSWFVYKDTRGVSREDYLRQFEISGEYLANMDFVQILMDESHDRYQEISSWGARTGREYYYQPGSVSRSIEVVDSGDAMRGQVVDSGVRLLERVMVTSLIKSDDSVIGAVGFHLESGRPYAVLAKATVMCAGPASFKPLGLGYPCAAATADGDAMAYRVGAEISGKEFNDGHPGTKGNPLEDVGRPPKIAFEMGGGPPSAPGPAAALDGNRLGMRIQAAFGAHESGVPIDSQYIFAPGSGAGGPEDDPFHPFGNPAGYASPGLSNHKAEGVFPQDIDGASNVPGLWAAGDGLSSMQNGAGYAGFGCSCAGSSVQGARAGRAAAEYAKRAPALVVDPEIAPAYAADMLAPLGRARGYTPGWVTRLLQNIMFPYYVMYVKERTRLEAALQQIMYLQQKYAPALKADDAHELRSAHETRNMLLNAEMKLRAGLVREESRGTHFREDFPYRDDERWLAWVKLVKGESGMVVVKHPVPAEWHPRPSLSYRERYPVPFPGEDDYLRRASPAEQ